jgi:hypothetical protein
MCLLWTTWAKKQKQNSYFSAVVSDRHTDAPIWLYVFRNWRFFDLVVCLHSLFKFEQVFTSALKTLL